MLVPFVEDQPRRRHQIEHRGHDAAVAAAAPAARNNPESRAHIAATARAPRRRTAGRRIGSAGLRPDCAALGGLRAIGRRPRQRQHVEIELARRVLPAILRRGGACDRETALPAAAPRPMAVRSSSAGERRLVGHDDSSRCREPKSLARRLGTFQQRKWLARTASSDDGRSGWTQGFAALQAGLKAQSRSRPTMQNSTPWPNAGEAAILDDRVMHACAACRRSAWHCRCNSVAECCRTARAGTRSRGSRNSR